jgi:hypothetical protein
MRGSFRWDLEHISSKCASYWQSVLLVGLPFTILYRGTDYVIFRIITGNAASSLYPWRAAIAMDVPVMLLVSAIWWCLMRQLAAWRHKYEGGGSSSSSAGGPGKPSLRGTPDKGEDTIKGQLS